MKIHLIKGAILGVAIVTMALDCAPQATAQTPAPTPEQQLLLDEVAGFEQARRALATGDNAAVVRILKPLAARGSVTAISTLKKMGITQFVDPPKIAKAPQVSRAQRLASAEAAQKNCFANLSTGNIDSVMSRCETAHLLLSNLADGTNAVEDDKYYYQSGVSKFQLAKLSRVKAQSDAAGMCAHLHAAARQFKRIKQPIQPNTEPFIVIGRTTQMLANCKAQGL